MKVYLVRHGETEANASLKTQGANEPLSHKGEEQARLIAERFRSLPIGKILTSPHLRTMKTAEEIARVTGKTPEHLSLLKEFSWPSAWIGRLRNDPEIQGVRSQIEENWTVAPDTRILDEETFIEIRDRATKTLELLASIHDTTQAVAVVSHARFLKVLISVLIHGPAVSGATASALFYRLSLNNTGLTVAEYDEKRKESWSLLTINDHAHLGDYHRQHG